MSITCCKSCGVGCSSVTEQEIQEQRNKYDGKYICRNCEDTIEKVANSPFGKFEAWGNSNCLITKDGIYVDKGMRPRGEKFLGFGGRLFLIIETVQEEYLRKKKVYLTNNLFSIKSIDSCLVDKYKHNINAEIINIDWDSFDKLKNQLDKIQ